MLSILITKKMKNPTTQLYLDTFTFKIVSVKKLYYKKP